MKREKYIEIEYPEEMEERVRLAIESFSTHLFQLYQTQPWMTGIRLVVDHKYQIMSRAGYADE